MNLHTEFTQGYRLHKSTEWEEEGRCTKLHSRYNILVNSDIDEVSQTTHSTFLWESIIIVKLSMISCDDSKEQRTASQWYLSIHAINVQKHHITTLNTFHRCQWWTSVIMSHWATSSLHIIFHTIISCCNIRPSDSQSTCVQIFHLLMALFPITSFVNTLQRHCSLTWILIHWRHGAMDADVTQIWIISQCYSCNIWQFSMAC